MTLEDFFTLTEMKDGLTIPSRVHELVAVMQREKDSIVKNIGDATRQWTAVASTIAATENKDCIDLFIQLDGLWFIDRWLRDAKKFSDDTTDGFIEESITALLRALEKLQIDREKSISSGIWTTVSGLLDHKSTRVQDRARVLFDSWKQSKVSDVSCHDINELNSDSSRAESVAVDISISKESAEVENDATELAMDKNLQSTSSNCLQPVEDVQIQSHGNELHSHRILDSGSLENASVDTVSTSVLLKEKSTSNVEGTASNETNSSLVPKGQNSEPGSDSLKKSTGFPDQLAAIASSSSERASGALPSSIDAISSRETATGPAFQNKVDAKEGDSCLETTASGEMGALASAPTVCTDDVGASIHSDSQESKSIVKDGECCPVTLQDLSGNGSRFEKTEDSRMEDMEGADHDMENSSDVVEGLRSVSDFSKSVVDTHSPGPMERRTSDMEIEFGIDALEVARQVAQEVEREVVDYREPSCSSASEKIVESGVKQPSSPASINGKEEQPTEVSPEDMPTTQNQSAETHTEDDGHLINSSNMDTDAEHGAHELVSSQVAGVAQAQEGPAEKGLCDFDLNEEVCSDVMDHVVNPVSAPISFVSASRPLAASGSPVAPFQFQGSLGWKGSAATSAFRPASPRKTSDVDRTFETGGISGNSKQRQNFLDFDLNVAEGGDEKVADLISGMQNPPLSGLGLGESSLDVGPRRSERPTWDLNLISDDGDAQLSDLRMEGRFIYPRNGHRSPSPASSSSSLRNFDLNDRPVFQNDSSNQVLYHGKSSQSTSTYGGSKPGDPVISIMGARVEVKKDLPQPSSLPNGKPWEPALDANVARMGGVLGMVPTVPYAHSPVFGYNGLTTAPTLSISSAVYRPGGSIPYMLDSRGAPVVPQIMGSASAAAPYSQSPFIMSMGPSRPNLDLNSGFAMEGGSTGGLRQFLTPSQGRSVDDNLRINSQPSSSSDPGGKRKEPDGGWETYTMPYRHPQSPWR